MTERRASRTRRALAGLVLVSVAASLLALPFAGARIQGCESSTGASTPAALVPDPGHGCPHADVGVCVSAACLGAPPALRMRAPVLTFATAWAFLSAPRIVKLADLYQLGPPTPPPNS